MACTTISNFSDATKVLTFNKTNEEHRKLIRHLYRRIGYGASWTDIENAHGKTISALVDELIDNHLNDYQRDSEGNVTYDANGNPTVVVGGATHIFNTDKFDWVDRDITLQRLDANGNAVNAVSPTYQNHLISDYWTNESIIGGSNSVRAKLMQFWQDHFAIEEGHAEAGRPPYLLRYFKVLFNNAFGNFRTFVEEIGRTPSMLGYLNGYLNICNPGNDGSRTPDENYARELLELFTMGEEYKELDAQGVPVLDGSGRQVMQSNYEDSDVNNLARALSGWTFNDLSPIEGELQFRYGLHDWTMKAFVGGTIEGGITPPEPTTPIDPSSPYWEAVFGLNSKPPGEETLPGNYTFRDGTGTVIGTPLDENLLPAYDINQNPNNGGNFFAPYPNDANAERAYLTVGHLEYKAIHDIIFTNRENAIAYFICRKLYEFYIYGNVEGLNRKLEEDEGLQPSNLTKVDEYIEALAEIFKGNNPIYTNQGYVKWDIIPVIKHLFKSQHFYDAGIIGAQIKSPIDCGTSIFRAANLQGGWGTDGSIYDYRYKVQFTQPGAPYTQPASSHPNYEEDGINYMTGEGIDTDGVIIIGTDNNGDDIEQAQGTHALRSLQSTDNWEMMYQHWGRMGQFLFNPPDVAGWPGYHFWLNEFTWIKRREMARYFLTKRFINTRADEQFRLLATTLSGLNDINISPYGYTFEEAVTPMAGVQLIWKMWRHFFAVEPTERQIKDGVAAYLDAYPYMGFPPPTVGNNETRARVRNVLLYFTEQPEYQLN